MGEPRKTDWVRQTREESIKAHGRKLRLLGKEATKKEEETTNDK